LFAASSITVSHAQSVDSVSSAEQAHAGRLVIRGSGFGEQPGEVFIGGHRAHLGSWADGRIAVYIDDATPTGTAAVSVITANHTRATAAQTTEVLSRPTPRGDRIRWRFDADGLRFDTRPAIAADGTIYAVTTSGVLHALRPDGSVKWTRLNVNGAKSASLGPDGTVYVTGLGAMVAALDPTNGQTLWSFPLPSNAGEVFSGPSVGPDGTIYVGTDENAAAGLDFGVAAISPDGSLKWNTSNNFGVRVGSLGYAWELTPGPQGLYFNSGMGNPIGNVIGVFALDLDDGSIMWSINALMWPQLGPDGNIYQRNVDGNFFASYEPDGTLRWRSSHSNFAGVPTGEIDLDPDSNFYTTSGINFASGDSDGNFRWNIRRTSATMQYANASPIGGLVVNQVIDYDINVSPSIRAYDSSNGDELWSQDLGFDGTARITQAWVGAFSHDGSTYYVPASGNNYAVDPIAPFYTIRMSDQIACPADLNPDGTLDFFDIAAFLAAFSSGDLSADFVLDGELNFFDVAAFLSAFDAGCP
jgi:outer membrane protein assembly factor BamB